MPVVSKVFEQLSSASVVQTKFESGIILESTTSITKMSLRRCGDAGGN